jgi:TonB family protein
VKEKIKSSKKINRILLFFLISLLVHAIILIVFMFHAFEKRSKFVIISLKNKDLKTLQKLAQLKKEKELKAKKNELPASLKPRKSTFGSTVFFDAKAQFTPPQAKIIGPQDRQGLDLDKPILQKVKNKEIQPQAKKEPTQKSNIENKKTTKKISTQKTIQESKNKSQFVEPKKEPAEKLSKEEIKKRIEDIETRQKMVERAHDLPAAQLPKMQKIQTFGQGSQDKSPIIRNTKKSIVAMTKGFIENLHGTDNGKDWLERKGDDNKRPSFEELKYISYEEKVTWQLQSSWKQNFAVNPTLRIPEGNATIEFQIKSDGTVHDIILLQTSGNPSLDQVIIKNIEFASPFPPLPNHFNTDNYRTGRIIHVTHQLVKF